MKCYMYRAALYCEDCVKEMLIERDEIMVAVPSMEERATWTAEQALEEAWKVYGFKSEYDYDSSDLPKGPYEDQESDHPDHCDGCQKFLENPLTEDGYKYVVETLAENNGDKEVLDQWLKFYGNDYAYACKDEVTYLVEKKKKENLIGALEDLLEYTLQVLTGPIMQAAGIQWGEEGPNGPPIRKAKEVLAANKP